MLILNLLFFIDLELGRNVAKTFLDYYQLFIAHAYTKLSSLIFILNA